MILVQAMVRLKGNAGALAPSLIRTLINYDISAVRLGGFLTRGIRWSMRKVISSPPEMYPARERAAKDAEALMLWVKQRMCSVFTPRLTTRTCRQSLAAFGQADKAAQLEIKEPMLRRWQKRYMGYQIDPDLSPGEPCINFS